MKMREKPYVTKITAEVGACSECNKENLCNIKESRQNILGLINKIDGVNDVDDPFQINMRCKYFLNKNNSYRPRGRVCSEIDRELRENEV